ncbi:hypothetical protein [Cupriavidus pauculus]|nr:hypothetical protein [Cupriavidus pauculus]
MEFVLKKMLEIAFLHVLPCYFAFKWAKRVGKNPWMWAVLCFLFSYFALFLFGFLQNRKRLPTYEEYRRAHPSHTTANGVSCSECGSRSIRMWRHQVFLHVYQYHRCNHCGTTLYRSR